VFKTGDFVKVEFVKESTGEFGMDVGRSLLRR
jgi:hypothetical protein